MKQTSVKWLIDQLLAIGVLDIPEDSNEITSIIEEANKKEIQEMIFWATYFRNVKLTMRKEINDYIIKEYQSK
jgi:hypothetical protein